MTYTQFSADELLSELGALQRAQEDAPLDPEPPFRSGQVYARLGDYASAVRAYLAALERNPEHLAAHYNLALAYAAQSRWDDAERAYRRVLWMAEDDHETWANLGAVYEAQGRLDDALACYRRAIQLNKGESEARHRAGRILMQQGEWSRAVTVFEEAVDLDEGDAVAWNHLGLCAAHRGSEAEAEQLYLKAVQVEPRYAQAWGNLGNLYAARGWEQATEEAYREAVRLDPNDPNLWFNLGEFYFRRRHPETETCLLKVVRLDRSDLEAWELLRQWNQHRPNFRIWKAALQMLLQARPEDLTLLREMALVHDRLGEGEEALGVLRRLIALDAEDEESRRMLAALYLGQSKNLEAFAHLTKLSGATGQVLDMWALLGQRLLHTGRREEAETCFLSLVAHRPLQTDAWQYLGELALEKDQLVLAFERFSRAVDLNRNDAAVWLPLAERFLAQGDAERALACLEPLTEHLRYLPQVWATFFRIHRAAGDEAGLLQHLERMLEQGRLPTRDWHRLAACYEEAGQAEGVQRCLARAREAGVESAPADELERVRRHLSRREGEQALRMLERLGASEAENPVYWRHRAEASYLTGDMEEARVCYEKALALDDTDFRAWFNLGNICFRSGNLRGAERAFEAAGERRPAEPKVWYNLGLTQDELGRDARESMLRALALDRRFPQAWNGLGALHFHRGDYRAARRAFVRCVALNRRSVPGWHNLAAAYRGLGRPEEAGRCEREVERLGGVVPAGGTASVRLFFDRDLRQ